MRGGAKVGDGARRSDGIPARRPLSSGKLWAICALVIAAALGLRELLDPLLGGDLALVTLFGAVAAAVWLGGAVPASVVALAGYVGCAYLFIEPRGALGLDRSRNLVGLVAYLFTCSLLVAIGEALRRARRLADAGRELQRVTLASIGDAVITTDLDGRVTYLNAVAETLTAWPLSDATGKPLEEVFRIVNEDSREPADNPAFRALREGAVVGLANHTLLLARDGTERPIDDSAAPIRDAEGEITGCVLVFRDIAERRLWERAERDRLDGAQLLATIVETSDDAILSKTLDGTIRSWNRAAERLFGHSAAEAVGRHISLIIPPERIDEEDRIIASLRAGEKVDHFETVRRRKDGSAVDVSLSISPLRDERGVVVGASKIARDITERRRAEDRLRRLADDLAEADRRKSEFLATLSHELRNPLAPMRNMLEVLKRSGESPEAMPVALATMERQLEHLVRLVDDLLDLNRITHDRIELQRVRVDLVDLVSQAVAAARPFAEASRHELRWSPPTSALRVGADPVRLAQVFGNLLHNACKYTPAGGTIAVTLDRRGDCAEVTIIDTGAGIPPAELARIFEMFTQVERTKTQAQGGLGIGLTLVKRLVELHGGTVSAASDGEGLGSRFVVTLPVDPAIVPAEPADGAEATGAAARDAAGKPRANAKQRVLVVDDNRDSAESLVTLLRLSGFESVVAHDGPGALEVLERERPDVALLDIGLPGLDGFEVCRRTRAAPWGRGVRMIALTGWGQEEDRAASREAGFDAHLVKPVDYDELLALLA